MVLPTVCPRNVKLIAGISGRKIKVPAIPRGERGYKCNMHQSFVTTVPTVLGNSGDFDFFLRQARVYARHCGDSLMVKALLKSGKLNVKTELLWPVWEWNQNTAIS